MSRPGQIPKDGDTKIVIGFLLAEFVLFFGSI